MPTCRAARRPTTRHNSQLGTVRWPSRPAPRRPRPASTTQSPLHRTIKHAVGALPRGRACDPSSLSAARGSSADPCSPCAAQPDLVRGREARVQIPDPQQKIVFTIGGSAVPAPTPGVMTGSQNRQKNSLSPWMEPCELRSGGAVFGVLVVSAQPQDGGRCLLGPTLRNEVEVVICDVEHVETAAVGRVRVVDRALGVL